MKLMGFRGYSGTYYPDQLPLIPLFTLNIPRGFAIFPLCNTIHHHPLLHLYLAALQPISASHTKGDTLTQLPPLSNTGHHTQEPLDVSTDQQLSTQNNT
jgi:hypothetical protein